MRSLLGRGAALLPDAVFHPLGAEYDFELGNEIVIVGRGPRVPLPEHLFSRRPHIHHDAAPDFCHFEVILRETLRAVSVSAAFCLLVMHSLILLQRACLCKHPLCHITDNVDGDRIAERFIALRIAYTLRPVIGEALQTLALNGSKPSDTTH